MCYERNWVSLANESQEKGKKASILTLYSNAFSQFITFAPNITNNKIALRSKHKHQCMIKKYSWIELNMHFPLKYT